MAYILAVNPQILSTTGMDFGAIVTATALAIVFCSGLGFLLLTATGARGRIICT